jgi:hypothetical protein
MWFYAAVVGVPFLEQYGLRFAFIDGHCRYFASRDPALRIVRGQLDDEEAKRIADDMEWERLESLSEFRDGTSCMDGSFATLSDGLHSVGCDCACDVDAPRGLAEAVAATTAWERTLADQGDPLDGPVRVVAFEVPAGSIPPGATQQWPLDRDLAGLVSASGTAAVQDRDAGVLVEDAMERAALRKLRTNAEGVGKGASAIYVQSGMLTTQLYIRDELPPEVEAAVNRFLAMDGG